MLGRIVSWIVWCIIPRVKDYEVAEPLRIAHRESGPLVFIADSSHPMLLSLWFKNGSSNIQGQ